MGTGKARSESASGLALLSGSCLGVHASTYGQVAKLLRHAVTGHADHDADRIAGRVVVAR